MGNNFFNSPPFELKTGAKRVITVLIPNFSAFTASSSQERQTEAKNPTIVYKVYITNRSMSYEAQPSPTILLFSSKTSIALLKP